MNFELYKLSTKDVFRQSRACYGIDERALLNPVTRWHCKFQRVESVKFVKLIKAKSPLQIFPFNFTLYKLSTNVVNVSYKRLQGLKMLVQQIKWLLLQPFRVATATTMKHSTTLVTTVTGGLLPRTIQPMPTTGT